MRPRALAIVAMLIAAASSSACRRQSMSELVAEHRKAVEATFAAIQKLAPAVQRLPRPTADRVEPPGGRVVIEPEADQNAAVIYEEDLVDPGSQRSVSFRTLRADTLGECGSMILKQRALSGNNTPHPSFVRDHLEACGRLKYLFVIKTEVSQTPSVRGTESFSPGKYVGVIDLYRIADQRHFGSFRVSAESSRSVTVVGKDSDSRRVDNDIAANVFVAIDDAIRKNVPSALPPPKAPK